MNKKTVSVVIPVYKVEDYLEKCVLSILNQTYTNFEILLIDDGSPDSCPQICDRLALLDSRISVIHKPNGGLSSARNVGIREAAGDYLLFLDSDDYWDDNNALKLIIDAADEDTDVVLFGYKKRREPEGTIELTISPPTGETGKWQKSRAELYVQSGLYCASAWNKLVRRALLLDNSVFFKEGVTSEDIEWSCLVLLLAKRINAADVTPYIYRQRTNSITTSMSYQNILQLRDNIIRGIERCEEKIDSVNVDAARAYMAYQLSTILFAAHNVKHRDMYSEIRTLAKYFYLLDYSSNRRIRFVRVTLKVFGLRRTYRLAGIYWKYRYG